MAGPSRSLLGVFNAGKLARGQPQKRCVPGAWARAAKLWRWKERTIRTALVIKEQSILETARRQAENIAREARVQATKGLDDRKDPAQLSDGTLADDATPVARRDTTGAPRT